MKKSDLKPGMVVKYRSGDLRILDDCNWLNYYDINRGRMEAYNNLENYSEDLKSKKSNYDEDIIAVYKDLRILFDENIEPLWEEDLMTNLKQNDLVWIKASKNGDWALRFLHKYHKDKKIAEVYTDGYNSKSRLNYENPVTVCFNFSRPYIPGEVI